MNRAPGTAGDNYGSIHAVRGIAACLVVIFHTMHVSDRQDFPGGGIWRFFDFGWVGVNLFLVISGLVITQSMVRHMRRDPQSYRLPFIVSRLARIVPLYLLSGAVFLAVVRPAWLLGPAAELFRHVGSHLAFVHNLHHHTHGSINGPNWSIALEMQFYLLVVLIAPLLLRPRVFYLAGALVAAATFRYVAAVAVPEGDIPTQFIYATQLPGLVDHFALGMALAFALDAGPSGAPLLQPGWRSFLCTGAAAVVMLGLLALLLGNFRYWENNAMLTFAPALAAAGFTALLAAALAWPLPQASGGAFRALRYLGEISYGLYLWHLPVLLFTLSAAPLLTGIALLATVLGATIVLSALSWHFVENPLNMLFRRRGPGRDRRGTSQLASTQFQ